MKGGDVFLQGRLKRVIVRHEGFKVIPSQLENVILNHPNVNACCVVGASDVEHGRGQIPIAFIEMKTKDDITLKELQELCQNSFAERYWPAQYRQISTLPLTPNGKVDFRALEKLAQDSE